MEFGYTPEEKKSRGKMLLEKAFAKKFVYDIKASEIKQGKNLHLYLNFTEGKFYDCYTDYNHPDTMYVMFEDSIVGDLPYFKRILFKGQLVNVSFPYISIMENMLAQNIESLDGIYGNYLEIKFDKKNRREYVLKYARIVKLVDAEKQTFVEVKELYPPKKQ